MLPLVATSVLAALASAVLNAQGRVGAAAVAPLAVNAILVAVLAALAVTELPAATMGVALSVAVSVAGLVQLLVLTPVLARLPRPPVLRWPQLTPRSGA